VKRCWFDDRYVPIVGDDIYHRDGTPLTEEGLKAVELERYVTVTGNQCRSTCWPPEDRVLAIPGPWIVPYVTEGAGNPNSDDAGGYRRSLWTGGHLLRPWRKFCKSWPQAAR